MSRFKVEDFSVGDKVTMAGVVKEVDTSETHLPLKVELPNEDYAWVGLDAITTHERNFRVGDRVKDTTIDGSPATVLAVDGDELWLKDDGGSRWTDSAKDFEIVS